MDQLSPEEEAETRRHWDEELQQIRSRLPWFVENPPPELTQQMIDSTPDKRLGDLILAFVTARMPADADGRDNSWLESLPRGLQLTFASLAVEGELSNGGFNQMFFNGTDSMAEAAIAAFRRYGAFEFAAVIEEALLRASELRPEILRSWRDGSMDDFMASYGDAIFDDLDQRLYALYETADPDPLRAEWIRAHSAELVTS
jgi:hypothetical protein